MTPPAPLRDAEHSFKTRPGEERCSVRSNFVGRRRAEVPERRRTEDHLRRG
jgi:hypothetical protein